MTQLSALAAVVSSAQEDRCCEGSISAERIAAADDVVRPGRRVPSLGVLESRPLTDRERLEAWSSLYWYATRGGC